MLAVLSGCVCSSISFSSVWSGSVLEIEGEFKAWWLFQTFLSSLHVWMPSSSLSSKDSSWYDTLLFSFYLAFLFWLIWVLGCCKFLILIDYMLIRVKLSNTQIMNLCFWFDVVADLVNYFEKLKPNSGLDFLLLCFDYELNCMRLRGCPIRRFGIWSFLLGLLEQLNSSSGLDL